MSAAGAAKNFFRSTEIRMREQPNGRQHGARGSGLAVGQTVLRFRGLSFVPPLDVCATVSNEVPVLSRAPGLADLRAVGFTRPRRGPRPHTRTGGQRMSDGIAQPAGARGTPDRLSIRGEAA